MSSWLSLQITSVYPAELSPEYRSALTLGTAWHWSSVTNTPAYHQLAASWVGLALFVCLSTPVFAPGPLSVMLNQTQSSFTAASAPAPA